MLTVRDVQMGILAESLEQVFLSKLAEHVEQVFPEPCRRLQSDGGLQAFLVESLQRAARWGVTGDRERALFVDLCFGLGAEFPDGPDHAWARHILALPQADGATRVKAIYAVLSSEEAPSGPSCGDGAPAGVAPQSRSKLARE